jgi:protein-S-isoprenylcysteine O-methyltransferase Ste14
MHQSAAKAGPLGRTFAWLGGAWFVASLLYFLYAYFVRFGREAAASAHGTAALGLNLALFTAFALHHSLLARTGAKRLVARLVSPSLERPVYVWISSVLFLLCCAWWRDLPGTVYSLPAAFHPVGWLVQGTGLWLTLRAARRLDVLELAGVRQAIGTTRAAALYTDGLYALVRHPIYLGWALLVLGAPHMTVTRFSFACVSTFYLMIAIPLEEQSLVRDFGDDYQAYRRRVRWRMIPGLY